MGADTIKQILFEAIELPPDQRDAFIAEQCADDETLRRQVASLANAYDNARSFLADETVGHPPVDATPDLPAGSQVGNYTIDRVLGEGGFGTVYLAHQEHPVKRRVALKIIKPGMDTRQVIRRFEQERQALAVMDHPGIARVFDAGTTAAGRPFFVMEFVDGSPITDYCDEHRLNIRRRLRLFERVCMAVQHAHQKGVIHRDIKPSNVIVTTVDGRPEPKVIDFGIAKAVDQDGAAHTQVTQAKQILGTPQYMSPEQASFDNTGIDTRTDVYSLGVLLYELLTGATPFDTAALKKARIAELERIIRDQEPPKPSSRVVDLADASDPIAAARRLDAHRLWRSLKGDLDWVTMRAMEKDPARRYPTAFAFAEDLRRYLRNDPVEAGPPARPTGSPSSSDETPSRSPPRRSSCSHSAGFAVGAVFYAVNERRSAERLADELAKSQAIADFAQSIITGVDPATARGEDTTLLKSVLDGAAERVNEELAEHPEAAVETFNVIGNTYMQIGDYEEAERIFKRATALADIELGDEHAQTLHARANLASAFVEVSRFEEAITIMEPVYETRRRVLGEFHPETISSLSLLGTMYHRVGRDLDAAPILESVLEMRTESLGPEHGDTLTTANNLAMTYADLGRLEDAAALLESVLESQKETLGEDHPQTLATINNLAGMYGDLDRVEEAEQMLLLAIEIKSRVLEPDHPSILISRGNLAGSYNDQGRHQEAYELYKQVYDTCLDTLGDKDMRTLAAMNGVAFSLIKLERFEDAEPYAAQAAALFREVAGDEHPTTVMLQSNVFGVWVDMGRDEQVLDEIEEWLNRAEAALGPGHPSVIGMRKTKSLALVNTGEIDAAEQILLDSHQYALDAHGPGTVVTNRTVNALADFYDEQNRPDDAASLARTSHRRRALAGPVQPRTDRRAREPNRLVPDQRERLGAERRHLEPLPPLAREPHALVLHDRPVEPQRVVPAQRPRTASPWARAAPGRARTTHRRP